MKQEEKEEDDIFKQEAEANSEFVNEKQAK